jgi:hypothetical protein
VVSVRVHSTDQKETDQRATLHINLKFLKACFIVHYQKKSFEDIILFRIPVVEYIVYITSRCHDTAFAIKVKGNHFEVYIIL